MDSRKRLLWIALAIGVVGMTVLRPDGGAPDGSPGLAETQSRSLSYSEMLDGAREGRIKEIVISGQRAIGMLDEGRYSVTALPNGDAVADTLAKMGVNVRVVPPERPNPLIAAFLSLLPMALLIGAYLWFMRRMQGGAGGGAMGFGRSRAKLHAPKDARRVTFEDVAGVDEAKADLEEVVEFLRFPEKFQRLGGKIPKGVLLVGPPGTGKTLLARAVAGEANVPFFTISGSDFVEMFVGVGASRVRDMFEQARKNAPCILFIDEIDAMGRHRGAGVGGGNDEREQTLNQMLVEMDGFAPNEGIILVAATNRPDVLDPALLRPGRFDRQVIVGNPDLAGREQILMVHTRSVPLAADADVRTVARGTPGFSGADLANLINEAALLAARRGRTTVSLDELESAKDKIMLGAERRGTAMSDEERRMTAYHEAAHALCAALEPASDPVHKATIVPRGRALGLVLRLPERDRVSLALDRIEADLTVAMAGRVAEEMEFGARKVTTGASSDIQMATDLARRMVTEWGFSKKLGTIRYTDNQQEIFLGHSVARQQNMSDETARLIDEEVRVIVEGGTARARALLEGNRCLLDAIASALLERETLTGADIGRIIRGEPLATFDAAPAPRQQSSVPNFGGTPGEAPALA